MSCLRSYSKLLLLPLLTLIYTVGELAHFLIGVVSRSVAQSVGYGDKSCLANNQSFPDNRVVWEFCSNFSTEVSCQSATFRNGTLPCEWNYNGLGYDYQLMAGVYFMVIFTTAGVIWGIVADKMNRVHLLSIATVAGGVAVCGTAFATRYWHLVLCRMATAATISSVTPIAASLLSDTYPDSQLAFAMGVFNSGIYLGFGISFAVGTYVTDTTFFQEAWRSSFLFTGLPTLLAGLLLFLTVRETMTREHEYELPVEVTSKTASPVLIVLLLTAACIRHSGGYAWGYNSALYFQTYYPEFDVGVYQTVISIVSGVIGVVVGGVLSDKLVDRFGTSSRTLVLCVSQLLSTPPTIAIFYLEPPYPFIALFIANLLSEMWFGVLYAILVDLAPLKYKTTGVAIALFVINNVGGSLPVLVEPLTSISSYRTALVVLYPGALLMSSLLFFACWLLIRHQSS